MKQINLRDLDDLAVGASILGSGGGGNLAYDLMIAKLQIETYGPVQLVDAKDLPADSLVVPIEYMGAPLVGIEKITTCRDLEAIVRSIEEHYQKKVDCLLPIEIGGANALAPLLIASKLGILVLDGDTLGRAFPELQISSCNVMGISPSPAFLADALGNTRVVHTNDAVEMEHVCRAITVEMGSSAALAFYIMNGAQAKNTIVPNTISQSIHLGRVMREAAENGSDPVNALLEQARGYLIGSGVISDIQQSIQDGFLQGSVAIDEGTSLLRVSFQNEYLMAYRHDKVVGSTPDILTLFERESGKPILSESLLYGLRVALISLPAPAIWKTPAGLALTAPQCFGYSLN